PKSQVSPVGDRGVPRPDGDPDVSEALDPVGSAHGRAPGWCQRTAKTTRPSAIRYHPKGARPRLVRYRRKPRIASAATTAETARPTIKGAGPPRAGPRRSEWCWTRSKRVAIPSVGSA